LPRHASFVLHAAVQAEWSQTVGVPAVWAKAGVAATVWITGTAQAAAAPVTAAFFRNSLRSTLFLLSLIFPPFAHPRNCADARWVCPECPYGRSRICGSPSRRLGMEKDQVRGPEMNDYDD
jgi:hypothetical protein